MTCYNWHMFFTATLRFLGDKAKDEKRDFNRDDWETISMGRFSPQQKNEFDCAIFVIMITDFFSSELELNFSQEHMPFFRERIFADIVRGYSSLPRGT